MKQFPISSLLFLLLAQSPSCIHSFFPTSSSSRSSSLSSLLPSSPSSLSQEAGQTQNSFSIMKAGNSNENEVNGTPKPPTSSISSSVTSSSPIPSTEDGENEELEVDLDIPTDGSVNSQGTTQIADIMDTKESLVWRGYPKRLYDHTKADLSDSMMKKLKTNAEKMKTISESITKSNAQEKVKEVLELGRDHRAEELPMNSDMVFYQAAALAAAEDYINFVHFFNYAYLYKEPLSHTFFKLFMREMIKLGRMEYAFSGFKCLISKGMWPDDKDYEDMITGCIINDLNELGLEFLRTYYAKTGELNRNFASELMEKFIDQGYLTQAEECYILMLRAGVKSNIGLGTKYMDLYASVGYLDKATRHLTRDIFTNNEWKASLDGYLTLIKRISNEYKREDLPARTRIQHANQLVALQKAMDKFKYKPSQDVKSRIIEIFNDSKNLPLMEPPVRTIID